MATQQQITYDYPYEIFDRISYYITSKQNGICQTVCRSWRALFTPSQYRQVQIRGRRQFNQLYTSLGPNFVGHYIRRLSLDDVYMTAQELHNLPILCPNLVELDFNGKSINTDTFNKYEDSSPTEISFTHWRYLRRLTEIQGLTVTNYLLCSPSSPLSSLTHLSIRFKHDEQDIKTDFLASLYRATDLQSLSLDSVTLSLIEMESIHSICPKLQELKLTNTKLEPIGMTLQEKRGAAVKNRFMPAKNMQTFEYKNSGDLYENYEWLYYFSAKYINLVKLELWCEYSISNPLHEASTNTLEIEERYGALASIGMNCVHLKSVNLFNISVNHWLFQAMDSVGTILENIALGDMTDNTIDLLQFLGDSKQNVSSLTLWGWPSLCIRETMEETIAMVGRCSDRLSSFEFSMRFSGIRNAPMPFDLLLNRCPRLSYLKLDNIQSILVSTIDMAKYNIVNNNIMFSRPLLSHVAFENGTFRNEVFEYLSIRCPNLTNLDIESCALIGEYPSEMEIKIHMPHHSLKSININHIRPPSSYHHLKQASDIRLFNVSQKRNSSTHQLFELSDYENYNNSLSFNYEQKPLEYSRPTRYIKHKALLDTSKPVGPLVSIQCQKLVEFTIGDFWVI